MGMVAGPRRAGVSRQVGRPSSVGCRCRMLCSAAVVSILAKVAPRQ